MKDKLFWFDTGEDYEAVSLWKAVFVSCLSLHLPWFLTLFLQPKFGSGDDDTVSALKKLIVCGGNEQVNQ